MIACQPSKVSIFDRLLISRLEIWTFGRQARSLTSSPSPSPNEKTVLISSSQHFFLLWWTAGRYYPDFSLEMSTPVIPFIFFVNLWNQHVSGRTVPRLTEDEKWRVAWEEDVVIHHSSMSFLSVVWTHWLVIDDRDLAWQAVYRNVMARPREEK